MRLTQGLQAGLSRVDGLHGILQASQHEAVCLEEAGVMYRCPPSCSRTPLWHHGNQHVCFAGGQITVNPCSHAPVNDTQETS